MNLLVLDPLEVGSPLPRSDRRVEHTRKILKKGVGDTLAAGLCGGPDGSCPVGTARVESWDGGTMVFSFVPEREAPPLRPVSLILGFPRPIQVSRILKDLTSLGVRRILMAATDLGEKSYAESTIFKEKDFLRPLLEGAEQAGNPRIPEVGTFHSLSAALKSLGSALPGEARWALDPYRAEALFGSLLHAREAPSQADPAQDGSGRSLRAFTLAVGSERGWTDRELDALGAAGFRFASLGDRILRTETACTAAVSLALAALGLC